MLKKWSVKLQHLSTGWITLAAVVVFVLFTALALPAHSAQAEQASGGAGSPDTTFFYSSADLYHFAEAYGPAGRAAYVRARVTFDVIWPLVYTVFLVSTISWLSRRAFAPHSRWELLNLVPVLAMLFDFLENTSAVLVMLRYPQPAPLAAAVAPVASLVKWGLVMGSFGLLLVVLVLALVRRK